MTQEEKDLLLKDLLGRLPYGVKVLYEEEIYQISIVEIFNETITICGRGYPMEVEIQKVKPYLLPISSMKEEQMEELCILCDWHDNKNDAKSILVLYQGQFVMNADVIDWLHENHFDYRGLIEKGLAIDATNLNIY